MERTLGYLILKMNDFDNCPIDQKQLFIKYTILRIKMIGLFKDVIDAEKTTRK